MRQVVLVRPLPDSNNLPVVDLEHYFRSGPGLLGCIQR
jgi:hypothetical protein